VSKKHAWLCASPDGIITQEEGGEDYLLEIKCPYSCKDKLYIDVPYYSSGCGLQKSHPYYTQVQIQLFCCELQRAEFMIYSSPGTFIITTVWRDDSFLDLLIPKLEKLYFETLLPKLAAAAAVAS
jgi:hypothetical protein